MLLQIEQTGMKMNAYVLFLTFLISHVYARDVDFCFADEDDPYLYMATKTAYHFVHAGKTRFQDVPSEYSWHFLVEPSSRFSRRNESLHFFPSFL